MLFWGNVLRNEIIIQQPHRLRRAHIPTTILHKGPSSRVLFQIPHCNGFVLVPPQIKKQGSGRHKDIPNFMESSRCFAAVLFFRSKPIKINRMVYTTICPPAYSMCMQRYFHSLHSRAILCLSMGMPVIPFVLYHLAVELILVCVCMSVIV